MNTLKSIGAVLAGLIAIFAITHLTDFILENSGLMKIPFIDNPLWLMILVTIYRCAYVAVGCYITAALAPVKPMRHVLILASIGLVLGILGAIAMWHEPPHWYPIAIIIFSLPSAWLGGKLRKQKAGERITVR